MPQREFDITIATDGSVEVHVHGFKGRRCLDAVRVFERAIGKITAQRQTSEFYEPDEQVRLDIHHRS